MHYYRFLYLTVTIHISKANAAIFRINFLIFDLFGTKKTGPGPTVGAQSIAPAQSIAHGQIGDSICQKN